MVHRSPLVSTPFYRFRFPVPGSRFTAYGVAAGEGFVAGVCVIAGDGFIAGDAFIAGEAAMAGDGDIAGDAEAAGAITRTDAPATNFHSPLRRAKVSMNLYSPLMSVVLPSGILYLPLRTVL